MSVFLKKGEGYSVLNARWFILFVLYFALYVFIYGFLSLRLSPVWDEVYDTYGQGMDSYIIVDRWGLALYRCIFELGTQPYVAGMVSGLAISASVLVLVRACGWKGYTVPVVFGASYMLCISWAYMVIYSFQADAIAVGMLCSTVSACCLYERGRIHMLYAFLLLVFPVSVYQMLLLHFAAVVVVLELFVAGSGWRGVWKRCVRVVTVLLSSVVAAYAISFIIRACWCFEPGSIGRFSGYQAGLGRWSAVLAAESLREKVMGWVYWELVNVRALGINIAGLAYPGQWVHAVAGVMLAWLLAVRGKVLGVKRALLLVAVYIMPYMCYPVLLFSFHGDVGALDARMFQAESVSTAAVCVAFVKWGWGCPWGRGWKIAGACAVVFALLKGAYVVSGMAREENRIHQATMSQYHEMGIRARIAAEQAGVGAERILVCAAPGDVPFGAGARMEMYGRRIPLSEQGKLLIYPVGIFDAYAEFYGEAALKVAGPEELERHAAALGEMPAWPKPGSVAVDGGQVIIKVGGAAAEPSLGPAE